MCSWTSTVFIIAFKVIAGTAALQAADGLWMVIRLAFELFCKAYGPLFASSLMIRADQ